MGMSFGKILKNLMSEHEITQTELAKGIGFTQRAVSKWVNEQSEPTETVIERVARFFSISADYLLGLSDDEFSNGSAYSAPPLSHSEQDLLDLYRSIPKELQSAFWNVIKGFAPSGDEVKKGGSRA